MKGGDLVRLTWPDGDQETGIFQRKERGFAVLQSQGDRVVGCLSTLENVEVLKESEKIPIQEYNEHMGIKPLKPIDWRWVGFAALVIFILIIA